MLKKPVHIKQNLVISSDHESEFDSAYLAKICIPIMIIIANRSATSRISSKCRSSHLIAFISSPFSCRLKNLSMIKALRKRGTRETVHIFNQISMFTQSHSRVYDKKITFSSDKIIATFIFICIYKHRNLSMNVFFASIDNFNIRLLPSAGSYTCGRADQTWRA